ncbi:MAG: hypothetical protein RR359_03315 [Bacilli bacterium]
MGLNTNGFKLGGVLVEKNIIMGKNKDTKKEWIMADLTIEVGENQRINLSLFQNKLKADGNENSIYTGIATIRDQFKSLNSQVTNKVGNPDAKPIKHEATTVATREECDFVSANNEVTLSMNHYVKDGKLQSNFRLSTRFVNRAKETDSKVPYIEGNLQGIITEKGVEKEDSNGNRYVETELTVPTFREGYTKSNGEVVEDSIVVDKFKLVLKDNEDAIDYCMSIFGVNTVCCIGVEPMIKVVSEEPKEPISTQKRGFGKIASLEPTTKIVREIRVVGGYDLEEREYVEDKAFNYELFEKAVAKYDKDLEDKLNENGKETTTTRGFGKKGGSVPF